MRTINTPPNISVPLPPSHVTPSLLTHQRFHLDVLFLPPPRPPSLYLLDNDNKHMERIPEAPPQITKAKPSGRLSEEFSDPRGLRESRGAREAELDQRVARM